MSSIALQVDNGAQNALRSSTCLETTNLSDKYMTHKFSYFNKHIYNLGDF